MKKRKTYPAEFKEEAIGLVEKEGLSCVQVEKDLGIGQGVVSRWIREKNNFNQDAFCGSGNVRPSEIEYRDLKKELERVKRERDILKKAVAIFSKEPNRYSSGVDDKNIPELSKWYICFDDFMIKSHFYRFIKKRIDTLKASKTKYPPKRRVNLLDYKENLKEMISVARQYGTKVMLLSLPIRPNIPLVVNAIPIPEDGKYVKWLRPSFIGKKSYVKSEFFGPTSELEAAVKKYPQWALAHYLLSIRYEKIREPQKAELELEMARKMDVDRSVVSEYNRCITEIAGDTQANIVDLAKIFKLKNREDLFLDERHPSALGHKIIAEEISRVLNLHNLLK